MTNELQKLMSDNATLLEHLRGLVTQFDEAAKLAVGMGHQINALSMSIGADENGIVPVEQWPQIGETVEISFVARGEQLVLRAVVEVPCHEKTSESAENDFLVLHPRREGVRTTFAEWPTAEPAAQTFGQLGGFGFERELEPVPEMAVHVLSTVPPPIETNEIGAIVHSAGFAPDHNPPGVELPAAKPKRAKTEYTAHEWAHSMHFLNFMKRQAPFKDWPAEKQNAKRDEFVASAPADERMNRWGQRFAKFCGVST